MPTHTILHGADWTEGLHPCLLFEHYRYLHPLSVFVFAWKVYYSIRTRPVDKAQHIKQSYEQDKLAIKLPPNRLFFVWSI